MKIVLLILLLCSSLVANAETPFRVSKIVLSGNRVTKPWVIERELRFQVNDSISTADLEKAKLRLLSLAIFNNVRVENDANGVVTVHVSEQFRFIPILNADPVEGSLNDALKDPGSLMDIVVFTAGVADINHRGNAGMVGVLTEFGARTGLSVQYRTRWLARNKPVALLMGVYSLKISDRHASVNGLSRRLRNNGAYVDVATRRGAASRLGIQLRFDHVEERDTAPAAGYRHDVGWVSPYFILDRRDLEWYPTNGMFMRGDVDQAFGSVQFVRSRLSASTYLPFTKGLRSFVLAARAYGGTLQDATPPWARYYFGFSDKFRGYASTQIEAANFLAGELELRFPITREVTYDVPLVGRYGEDIPFWLGGALFFERAQTQLDGTRNDIYAYGAALHVRFPYVQVIEMSTAYNRENELDIVFETGVRF